jgi:hypothetical protein
MKPASVQWGFSARQSRRCRPMKPDSGAPRQCGPGAAEERAERRRRGAGAATGRAARSKAAAPLGASKTRILSSQQNSDRRRLANFGSMYFAFLHLI